MINNNNGNGRHLGPLRYILYVQVVVSIILICVGIAFPVYIWAKYGDYTGILYDRVGNPDGHINYLFSGVALGLFFIAVAAVALWAAIRTLNNDKER